MISIETVGRRGARRKGLLRIYVRDIISPHEYILWRLKLFLRIYLSVLRQAASLIFTLMLARLSKGPLG